MTGPFAGAGAHLRPGTRLCKSPYRDIRRRDSGGTWGRVLKVRYDGIVMKAPRKSRFIYWSGGQCEEIIDASFLWGRDTYETDEMLKASTGII